MPIADISRNAQTRSVSAAATLDINDYIIVADATDAGFTITLVDWEDGAEHEVIVQMSSADSSGNTVTVEGNAGAFSTALASNGTTSALLRMKYNGDWFVVGDVSSVSAGAASSSALSAGLAASSVGSTASSQNTSQSLLVSGADSANSSQGLLISSADSANLSQSLLISGADSANTSQSMVISEVRSEAASATASQSIVLSTTTSTANSG